MLTKLNYSAREMIKWTRHETLFFMGYTTLIVFLWDVLGMKFLGVPWPPFALIGTAMAFILGFQNNAAYGRIWEARKIWGGIVNSSRSWGMKVQDMVQPEKEKTPENMDWCREQHVILIYRHIAWLTAMRHNMRAKRKWEVFDKVKTNQEWSKMTFIPERITSLKDDLRMYLSDEDRRYVLSKSNSATALLYLQSRHIRELKDQNMLWPFSFLELENLLEELFNLQGKSERIKNFPYPRQYATLSRYYVYLFVALLPFGLIPQFDALSEKLTDQFPTIAPLIVWGAIPFAGAVAWVFHTMKRIGAVGENPFEGSANDVPISTIARGIETDLRQMLDEDPESIPKQFPELANVQM